MGLCRRIEAKSVARLLIPANQQGKSGNPWGSARLSLLIVGIEKHFGRGRIFLLFVELLFDSQLIRQTTNAYHEKEKVHETANLYPAKYCEKGIPVR